MSYPITDACWDDRCEECQRLWCEHPCHEDQVYDLTAREWVLDDEEAVNA